jgi:hypothetical protein
MSPNFLNDLGDLEDGRIVGMATYPLDEVLLTVLVSLLRRMENFDEISMFSEERGGFASDYSNALRSIEYMGRRSPPES